MPGSRYFDTDGSGSVDRDELNKLMKRVGKKLSDKQLSLIIKNLDDDGDGIIGKVPSNLQYTIVVSNLMIC